jgi:3-mercaptopyruvate sulfurtransferase SseA
VRPLAGGLSEWRARGYPVELAERPAKSGPAAAVETAVSLPGSG